MGVGWVVVASVVGGGGMVSGWGGMHNQQEFISRLPGR